MSEMTELIAGSLEGVDRGETEQVDSQPERVDSQVDSSQQEAQPDEAEEAEIAQLQQELVAKNPKLVGKIDVPRHQAVLTRTRNQYEKQLKEHQERLEKLKWAESKETEAAMQALALAESDPQKFIELLMKDKRYGDLLQIKEVKDKAEEIVSERPGPNALSADGQFQYYDDKGIEELLGWHGSTIKSQLMKEVEQRFGPIEQSFKARQVYEQTREKNAAQVNNARQNWKGFKENEEAIAQTYMKNPQFSLHDAYREVVIPKFEEQTRVSTENIRKKLLEEMKAKPKAQTEDSRITPEATGEGKQRDIKDIIRENLPRE